MQETGEKTEDIRAEKFQEPSYKFQTNPKSQIQNLKSYTLYPSILRRDYGGQEFSIEFEKKKK
jgi:hypothetical protein